MCCLCCVQYVMFSIFSMQCALRRVQFVLYTVHIIFSTCSVQCMRCSVSVVCSVMQCVLALGACWVMPSNVISQGRGPLETLQRCCHVFVWGQVYNVQCTAYSVQFEVYSVRCQVSSVQSTECTFFLFHFYQ